MEAADHTDVLPIGRKIEKIRRLYGITQTELGELLSVSKQAVSKMEQAKQMDDERLLAIAKALNVTTDAIKNFNENAAFNIIANTYYNHASSVKYEFNPLEKILQLYDEKIALYERMIKEKNDLIEKLMQEHSK
jgi:transcriptional regulator with XRE-family HTH domain